MHVGRSDLTAPARISSSAASRTFNGTPGHRRIRFAEKIPSFSDNFTKIMGTHTIKTGFGWQENNDNQIGDVYSQYTFPNIAGYLAAKSGSSHLSATTQFSTDAGHAGRIVQVEFLRLLRAGQLADPPKLLMIYGIRWDRFQAPSGEANAPFVYTRSFHTPNKDWAPRLGFAYQHRRRRPCCAPAPAFSTKFRRPTSGTTPSPTTDRSRAFIDTFYARPRPPALRLSRTCSTSCRARAPGMPTIYAVTPNFKNAYTINTSIQIDARVDARTMRSPSGFVNTGARDQAYFRDMNLINPTGYLADGRPIFSKTRQRQHAPVSAVQRNPAARCRRKREL